MGAAGAAGRHDRCAERDAATTQEILEASFTVYGDQQLIIFCRSDHFLLKPAKFRLKCFFGFKA